MPVRQVSEPVPIERNHVYVISPANRLSTNDGYLRVSPANRRRGDHVAIDLFFRDLADVHKDHAFCVVLSGTGADGAVGLSRIKEQGGVTLVQSPMMPSTTACRGRHWRRAWSMPCCRWPRCRKSSWSYGATLAR